MKKIFLVLGIACTGCLGYVNAVPFDEEGQCWREEEETAFLRSKLNVDCEEKLVVAEDRSGRIWKFPSSCIAESMESSGMPASEFEACQNATDID